MEAIKILSGNRQAVSRDWLLVDSWGNRIRQVHVASLRDEGDCPACKRGEFPWLAGQEGSRSAVLCGRNAVQLTFPGAAVSLEELARKLEPVGQVTRNQFLVRLRVDSYELTVFPDGRAIIGGTNDVATARTLYAKYVGS